LLWGRDWCLLCVFPLHEQERLYEREEDLHDLVCAMASVTGR
jgi:hypothetical protein